MTAALGAGYGVTSATAGASPGPAPGAPAPSADADATSDDLPNPLADKRRELREQAITTLLNGHGEKRVEQRGPSTVMRVGSAKEAPAVDAQGDRTARKKSQAQYVELDRETTDRIFAVLVEFGDERHPEYPDKDLDPTTPGPTTFEGPARNAIPEPDRSEDNSTVWQPNYNRKHFKDIYFGEGAVPGAGKETESLKTYYERQSSGRYSVSGTVTNWVKVKYNEARYGRSNDPVADGEDGDDPAVCQDTNCGNVWNLVQDAVNAWVDDQEAKGRTPAQIKKQLATFDRWDRYDYDGDGDFNEPDGYLDHFQIVHAGGDQADGDPHQGEDAIWSHRWYTQTTPIGAGGPEGNPLGGSEIGDTGFWVGDYTMQPENGGVSVFTHEYGHDLDLPDLYDRFGGDNSVEFWSLMAQSRLGAKGDEGIGTRAGDLGAWEKLQLGWLDYEVVRPDQNRRMVLGPHEYNSRNAQGAVVVLPKKQKTTELVEPYAGEKTWWSGSGDSLANTITRDVTLPEGDATLSMQANWDIEDCGTTACDYAFVEVDDGSGWAAIPGSITKPEENNGIDGTSDGWVPATFDLSAYAGKDIGLRIRYQTDGAAGGMGFFADDMSLTAGGETLFESGAEGDDEGWTLDGWTAQGASFTQDYDNYYVASHRDYVSFDKYLKTGPYNFGFLDSRPDWVEHFPLQDGLLVSYWDTSQLDNDTSQHPGEGLILPVDANPRPRVRLDGEYWRSRVTGYDSPFSLEKSDSLTLHVDSRANHLRGLRAQPTFNDGKKFWYAATPDGGVKVPNNGVNIGVLWQRGNRMKVRVYERP
ncbi:immune inhibitor A domain-containing protein [Solicola gregarius]|uniref:Immune inhibitor A n=1 Tax=Solicola gregarius TaxID=2908642 RepID=A0AA46TIE5_9ACTN|nr:immune inhibitor A domain-containing protein [Solicola gregarius]UYM05434.1 immune inhibitor A [Solicola gregarius]